MTTQGQPAPAAAGPPQHLGQIDLIRIVPMIGVVAVHALIFTQPTASPGSNAVLMILHANREVFFFVTAFVLFLAAARRSGNEPLLRFWRRRYPFVVAPYLAWTAIYWLQTQNWAPWPPGPALTLLGVDLALGWFHLYFLLVTMQLYAVFPLLAWLVRRTRGRHWWLLGASLAVQVAFTALFQYGSSFTPGWLQTWFAYAQVQLTSYQLYFVMGALAADHLDECLAWIRRHGRAALLAVVGATAVAEAWYGLNQAVGETADQAAGVFQPAAILVAVAALVGLALAADWLALAFPNDGLVWRTVRRAARTSFGVYLGHMLPLQLLLLTPLATLIGLHALPLPLLGVAVLAIVLGATFAMVVALQRTRLSVVLTGRQGRVPRQRWRAASPATAAPASSPTPESAG
ncbi:MAG TPA: acyltransferase [Candidatus Dormibacteraeota bacterium]|nr:acyltransferase [Candidatus Dormibacteraeota bacterium]